eukprot:6213419-Pleurochrysis_carterae.AAC.1
MRCTHKVSAHIQLSTSAGSQTRERRFDAAVRSPDHSLAVQSFSHPLIHNSSSPPRLATQLSDFKTPSPFFSPPSITHASVHARAYACAHARWHASCGVEQNASGRFAPSRRRRQPCSAHASTVLALIARKAPCAHSGGAVSPSVLAKRGCGGWRGSWLGAWMA